MTITELSMIPEIKRQLKELAKAEVVVGVKTDNRDLAIAAAVTEFGAPAHGIPSRPYIRTGKKRATAAIRKHIKLKLKELAEGGGVNVDQVRDEIGRIGLAKLEQVVDKWKKPPLSARYAQRKGNKKVLVDTRELREALMFKIKPRARR